MRCKCNLFFETDKSKILNYVELITYLNTFRFNIKDGYF